MEGIKETEAMIPDCQVRLEAARADLKQFLESHEDIEDVTSSDTFKEAQSLLLLQ